MTPPELPAWPGPPGPLAYVSLAETLTRTAQAHGLTVHHDPELLQLLAHSALDAQIPPALHQAVAELLVWLYGLEHDQAAA